MRHGIDCSRRKTLYFHRKYLFTGFELDLSAGEVNASAGGGGGWFAVVPWLKLPSHDADRTFHRDRDHALPRLSGRVHAIVTKLPAMRLRPDGASSRAGAADDCPY